MKQLAILSGKGGTGKTTIAAAFTALASNKIIADCDVDAPNLYLVLNPEIKAKKEFKGSKTVVIDEDKCTECGLCEDKCRFDAIHDYEINPILCEGCGVCVISCPEEAIRLEEGKIRYDESITKAMVEGVPVVEFETETKGKAAEEIKGMWNRINQILQ
ncbi:MAG: 4Fe-4S binding protein [archaeon]|nr:4Fe-4S binding protein [archaeon]